MARFQPSKREKKDGKPTYKYFIYAINKADKQPVKYEISLGELFISDISFVLNKKQELVCTGFYSKNSSSGMGGTFFMLVDSKTKAVTSKSIKEFTPEFLTNFMSEKKANKEGQEIREFDIREIVLQESV